MTVGDGLQARLTLARADFQLDVALELPAGQVSALFGPSGSGKTSCLRAIAGLERAARGSVVVNGEVWQDDARKLLVPVHQRALGYVFQDARLFSHLNVADNLAFGMRRLPPAQRRVSLDQAVALLGISHLTQRKPDSLSGGERQRVCIARALATSPRILLMDEPLAALDAARKAEILPYLEQLHRELAMTVVYVSHAPDEVARLADHLVLLDRGKVLAAGPTADMLTRLDLPLAHGDGAAAVLVATVIGHEAAYHLSVARFGGGELNIPRQTAAIGQSLRIRVQARDVSLSLLRPSGTSILNILPARVLTLSPDSPGQVMVQLDAGGCTLLARITEKSAHGLALVPGVAVFAQIKGVAILG
ncbi:molybdenum ABC transporter ATP-binding protein [Rhodoferax sp.]|uniref:molybdenum ABC transporter ATP-binding protein n=1 Tax=Rhodoferax sp. TaxID=50421 RepID=UPI00276A7D6D|nr:molybdenum ABC transporter ATP-binding protein [Rhodoferax sp.]